MGQGIPGPDPADYYAIKKQGRYFALYQKGDQLIWEEGPQEDQLVCICVYRKGAEEVRRRLVGKARVRSRPGRSADSEQLLAADGVIDEDAQESETAPREEFA